MHCYDFSKLSVLIVERQAPMRALLRQVLHEFGVGSICDAHTPEKAFEEFNRLTPDLVLVDWCPDFDGIGLVKRIRADHESAYPQVPIIMVSAYGETHKVQQARNAGASEYLVKPVSPSLIYVRIASAIENARPFIRGEIYTGPCRRRHALPFAGNDRRQLAAVIGAVPAATPVPAKAA